MPSSRTKQSATLVSSIEELRKSREDLISCVASNRVDRMFPEIYTEAMDQYFRRSLQESEQGQRLFKERHPFAFVALGGYGRRDLCLHSDIDVMILFNATIPPMAKALTEDVFYPLWDAGFELGYGTRSIRDCLSLANEDHKVLTSMMDARFICGNSPLYLSLAEDLQKRVASKKARALERWLAERDDLRMALFGDASHLLEPDLKEGIGGLRDYHHMWWLGRVFFDLRTPRDLEYQGLLSHAEYEDLRRNLDLIRLVRNHLHYLSDRKNDRLAFEHQVKIAGLLGFQDREGVLAVEQFLGSLHKAMASIKSLHRSFVLTHFPDKPYAFKGVQAEDLPVSLSLVKGEISFASATALFSEPLLLMEIFLQGCRLGVPLSLEAKRLVREFLYLSDDSFRKSELAVGKFLSVLNHPKAFDALDQMDEVGLLQSFIPEFGEIRDRVQFDNYHLYPVGTHSLHTVKVLKELAKEKTILLLDVLSDVEHPEVLFLAALFHDIGKIGKGHARKGAFIARDILKRFRYDDDRAKDVLFLVAQHLLLVETATRRDLNDEKVVVQCARTVETIDRLKMLYLLTWADSRATGPRAWNVWIENLVQELLFKALHILEEDELATPDASRRMKVTLHRVQREIGDRLSAKEMDTLFEAMGPRYLLETKPSDALRHITAFKNLEEKFRGHPTSTFSLDAREEISGRVWELTFVAKDRPGLFADMTGVLALHNINILAAHIYTWRDGTAVDVFRVSSPLDPIHAEDTWEKVRRDLASAFKGDLPVSTLLKEKARPSLLSPLQVPTRPPDVIVDNESSDFFSVIEVFADDRVGLLYQITHALFELGLDIRIAKIATKADQVADVFYVQDLVGQKVFEKGKTEQIKRALLRGLKQC